MSIITVTPLTMSPLDLTDYSRETLRNAITDAQPDGAHH
jgi:hypothetical protein